MRQELAPQQILVVDDIIEGVALLLVEDIWSQSSVCGEAHGGLPGLDLADEVEAARVVADGAGRVDILAHLVQLEGSGVCERGRGHVLGEFPEALLELLGSHDGGDVVADTLVQHDAGAWQDVVDQANGTSIVRAQRRHGA